MAVSTRNKTKYTILSILRKHGTLAVKDIAGLSGLSFPGCMNYISPMIESGLLAETVSGDIAVGRKPHLVSIAPNYRYVMGIDLGVEISEIEVADLNGGVAARKFIGLDAYPAAEEKIAATVEGAHAVLAAEGIPEELLSAIVIGNPGVVDPKTGRITMQASFASWYDLPLRQIFEREFQAQVEVVNDVNLATIGEKEYGAGRDRANFVYMRDDVGIKAGIILNNNLFRGESNAAGEFGRGIFYQLSERNSAGGFTRIEDSVTMRSLLRDVAAAIPAYPGDLLRSLCRDDPQSLTIEDIRHALDGNSPCAAKIVGEKARLLAYAIVDLALVLDVRLFILGGEIEKLGDGFLRMIQETVDRSISRPIEVQFSDLGNHSCIRGAVYTALNHVFSEFSRL